MLNKELIDRAWRALPAEFKRVVKAHYAGLNAAYKAYLSKDSLTNEECDRCKAIREKTSIYSMYFGEHNLTSDAEGEEMLQERLWNMLTPELQTYCMNMGHTSHDGNVEDVLDHLFGSKCLHDNVDSLVSNVDSLEPNSDGLNEYNFAKSRAEVSSRAESTLQRTEPRNRRDCKILG